MTPPYPYMFLKNPLKRLAKQCHPCLHVQFKSRERKQINDDGRLNAGSRAPEVLEQSPQGSTLSQRVHPVDTGPGEYKLSLRAPAVS